MILGPSKERRVFLKDLVTTHIYVDLILVRYLIIFENQILSHRVSVFLLKFGNTVQQLLLAVGHQNVGLLTFLMCRKIKIQVKKQVSRYCESRLESRLAFMILL